MGCQRWAHFIVPFAHLRRTRLPRRRPCPGSAHRGRSLEGHQQSVMLGINSRRTMEKERVMWSGIFYQPLHGIHHIGLSRKSFGIPSIVGQHSDVFWFKTPTLCRGVG